MLVKFIKDNSVTIMKVGGLALTCAGAIVTAIAGDKQQKIDIAEAVEKVVAENAK